MEVDQAMQRRLSTFSDWPAQAPVPKHRLALGGFVHIGGSRTKCLSCGVVISDWQVADQVIQRHREASPNCAFVRFLPSAPPSAQGPSVGGARSPTAGDVSRPMQVDCALPPPTEMNESLFLQRLKASEEARFETFYDWPLDVSPPRRLSRAGFYYLHDGDRGSVTMEREQELGRLRSLKDWPAQAPVPRNQLAQDYDVADAHPRLCKIAAGSLQQRLRTFLNWPLQAPVPKEKLAEGGFEHIGGLRTHCRYCDLMISDWQDGDSVIQRHRDASPHCSLVQSLQSHPLSSAIAAPSIGAAEGAAGTRQVDLAQNDLFIQRLKASGEAQNNASLPWLMTSEFFLQPLKTSEEARLATLSDWPAHFLPPQELAQAGLCETTTVHCAFCRGVVHGTKRGDDPLRDHARDNPLCMFLLNREMASGDDNSGQNVLGTLISELPKLNISLHLDPKHPEQASPDARMRSFEKWPSTSPKKPVELVKAGFFYIGLQDYTKCFQCDRGLCNWEASDDPWEEHACRYPRCQFVLLNKGEAYVDQCLQRRRSPLNSVAASTSARSSDERDGINTELEFLMRSEYVKLYRSQGVPVETLRTALVDHMRNQSRGFASPEELSHILDAILLRPRSSNGPTAVGQSSPSGNAIRPPEPNAIPQKPLACRVAAVAKGGASSGLPLEPSDLAEENLRLKEQWLCKVCLDAEVGVLFLPCGHLVACPACASALTSCAVCRREILGMVRTFHS